MHTLFTSHDLKSIHEMALEAWDVCIKHDCKDFYIPSANVQRNTLQSRLIHDESAVMNHTRELIALHEPGWYQSVFVVLMMLVYSKTFEERITKTMMGSINFARYQHLRKHLEAQVPGFLSRVPGSPENIRGFVIECKLSWMHGVDPYGQFRKAYSVS
jgi:hypothetical protein